MSSSRPPPRPGAPRRSGGRGVPKAIPTTPAAVVPSVPDAEALADGGNDPLPTDLWRTAPSGMHAIRAWLGALGWSPFAFQEDTWASWSRGESGLVQVPTGAGKTYAAYLAPLGAVIDEARETARGEKPGAITGLRVLYITPLRAVSRDIERAMKRPLEALGLHTGRRPAIAVESRTGDTSSSVRARQRETLPAVLITTPESLCLLLADDRAAERFASLHTVICDEWHELLSSKRGSQTELALARLRTFAPSHRAWALSATVGNPRDAALAVTGVREGANTPTIITADLAREVRVTSLLPDPDRPFPWAGHLGMPMLHPVLAWLDTQVSDERTTIVFVNTRSQAELWYNALRHHRPAWEPDIALHHGSLDRDERERVELGLKTGTLRVVIATSSLDLGVDFAPVDRVMQIGSVKGIARLIQRAGRAAHRPGEPCEIVCVPTHGLELIEIASAREAVIKNQVENRPPEPAPLDVLAQHMVTVALGGGFRPTELFEEVRTAFGFRTLERSEFDWTLRLVEHGGESLSAYPDYHRVAPDEQGIYRVPSTRVAQLHRFNVGTITSDATIEIKFIAGRSLGRIEEHFVSQLRKGERFVFAGRVLEFVMLHDSAALVRRSSGRSNHTPRWGGTKLPISESLASSVRAMIERVREGDRSMPELRAAAPLIDQQARMSVLPRADQLLIEHAITREGAHLFVYPFEGRLVHAGLAAILALRLGKVREGSFAIACNDYGFELLADRDYPFDQVFTCETMSADHLAQDAVESMNLSQMAKRQFRDVARIAGLVLQNYPGQRKGNRQVSASSSLIYDVLSEFEPDHLLLHQARREVLEKQFEQGRLRRLVDRLNASEWVRVEVPRPTPLALPLVIERIGARLSTESVLKRVERLTGQWTG